MPEDPMGIQCAVVGDRFDLEERQQNHRNPGEHQHQHPRPAIHGVQCQGKPPRTVGRRLTARWRGGGRPRPDGEGQAATSDGPVKVKQIVREAPKVGRNDPCPCGSGKKYKKCCGA